jgi:hypothetical protein
VYHDAERQCATGILSITSRLHLAREPRRSLWYTKWLLGWNTSTREISFMVTLK